MSERSERTGLSKNAHFPRTMGKQIKQKENDPKDRRRLMVQMVVESMESIVLSVFQKFYSENGTPESMEYFGQTGLAILNLLLRVPRYVPGTSQGCHVHLKVVHFENGLHHDVPGP